MREALELKPKRCLVVFGLSILGLVFSILVYLQHLGNSVVNEACHAIGVLNQCDIVGASNYATLLGIDNAIIGMIGFSVLAYLAIYNYYKPNKLYKSLIITGSIVSGLLALSFIYIQMFVIHAYCIYCLVVDAAAIVLLAIAAKELRKMIWG
jgi:uncharacterized membrane protein